MYTDKPITPTPIKFNDTLILMISIIQIKSVMATIYGI
jgi:hypothetical protein